MRTTKHFLVAVALFGHVIGCDWRTFDDLRDSAWVDIRSVSTGDLGTSVGATARPGDRGFEGPRAMRVNHETLEFTTIAYDDHGGVQRKDEDISGLLGQLTPGVLPLVARDDASGTVVAALSRLGGSMPAYRLVRAASALFDANAGDVDVENPWLSVAVSADRLAAISTAHELAVYDLSSTPITADSRDVFCETIDTSNIAGEPTVGDRVAILASGFSLATSNGALLEISHADCIASTLGSTAVDGPLLVGRFFANPDESDDGKDVIGAVLGQRVVILADWLGPGTITPEVVIDAPADASSSWGEAIAVGDFDGDNAFEIAIGDPGAETVSIVDPFTEQGVRFEATLSSSIAGFGAAVSAVPFGLEAKDVLVVGGRSKIATYFRVVSEGDSDPRN